jgi:hypothetical protein
MHMKVVAVAKGPNSYSNPAGLGRTAYDDDEVLMELLDNATDLHADMVEA